MILAIEAKALAVALTPHQLHNEIRETFDPSEHSALTRHQERCDWLHAHRNEVLAHAGITDDDSDGWETLALIAVDEEVFSPLLKSVSMLIRPWQELVALVAEGKML